MSGRRFAAAELLASNDPLSDAACASLIAYREEDELVDFKGSFDPGFGKSWIDLAVDCVAFANTRGGFVVLGVADKTWEPVGLYEEAVSALADTKKVVERINRNLAPALTAVRTREFQQDGRRFILICVPCSLDCTHVFESNLDWQPPAGGDRITVVRKGAIYIRRAASNQIMTAADFEALVNRRLQRFRDKVLDGITRVVQAPADHEVITILPALDSTGGRTVTVGAAPDRLGLVGKPLRFASQGVGDRLSVYRALMGEEPQSSIDVRLLFEAYAVREELGIDEGMCAWIATHSLVQGAPVFWWVKDMKVEDARHVLEGAFKVAKWRQEYVLAYSGFFGEKFYNKLREGLQAGRRSGARPYRAKAQLLNVGPSRDRAADTALATEIARALASGFDQHRAHELERLDCSLYAPF